MKVKLYDLSVIKLLGAIEIPDGPLPDILIVNKRPIVQVEQTVFVRMMTTQEPTYRLATVQQVSW